MRPSEPTSTPGHSSDHQETQRLTLTQPCIHARPRIPRDLLSVIPGPAPHACKPAWDKASITHMMTSVPGRRQPAACRVRTQPSPGSHHQPRDQLCPIPAPKHASTSFRIPRTLHSAVSGTGPGHGSACQWASTSPRTWLHKLVSRHQPQDPIAPDCPPGSQH